MTGPLVCILAAGQGTRVKAFGGALHKALLPLGSRPVITHIIGEFPPDARFVVALGHKAAQLREYLELAHPTASFAFVEVDPYEGPGSGPGRSLWACRANLIEPFVLTACDSICTKTIPAPSVDWMGAQTVDDPEHWLTIVLDDNRTVRGLRYKDPQGTATAFVGVAGVASWDVFFDGLAESLADTGEVQVDAGFEAIIRGRRCVTTDLGWHDTGTDATYRATRAALGTDHDLTFDGKETDVTFHVGDRVLKVFLEPGRARRVEARLAGENAAAPRALGVTEHVLSYEYVDGPMLDGCTTAASVVHFLAWADRTVWRSVPEPAAFTAACAEFYFDKTKQRLATHLALTGAGPEIERLVINGRDTATVQRHLDALAADRTFTSGALASTFHGDLHGGNIVCVGDDYRLIDWREDFGGIVVAGDRYYDLAKFLHTLELTVDVMHRGTYEIVENDDGILLSLPADPPLAAARRAFWSWAGERYDARRIAIVDALIFVNMAPLYPSPLGRLLYLLGRLLLDAAQSRDIDPAEVFDTTMVHDLQRGTR